MKNYETKVIILLFKLCVSVLAFAQPDTIPCASASTFYQVLEGNQLVSYDVNANSFNYLGSQQNFDINAIGYNVLDGYIYGIRTSNNNLVRVNSQGNFSDLGDIGLPNTSDNYFSGDFNVQGHYYVYNYNDWYRIDMSNGVSNISITPIDFSNAVAPPLVADITYCVTSNRYYGITNSNSTVGIGHLIEFDFQNNQYVDYGNVLSSNYSSSGFGAAYSDINGNLYFFYNQLGHLHMINIDSLPNGSTSIIASTGESLSRNDGASCALSNGIEVDDSISASSCCDSVPNLIENGNFENGNVGFNSDYNYQSTISPNSIIPSQYGIIDESDAAIISTQWAVADASTCDDDGSFMIVNGMTQQTGTQIVWEQKVAVEEDKSYTLCANFKNLPQCTFDILPEIKVVIGGGGISEYIIVDETTGSCDWMSYISPDFNPTGSSVNIQLLIDETGLGDGNDFAVDNISLQELIDLDNNDLRFQICTSDNGDGTYSINATPDNALPFENCEYEWRICERDFNTRGCNDLIVGGATDGWNYSTTDFTNFRFDYQKLYFLKLWADCECSTEAEYIIAISHDYIGSGSDF